MLGNTVDTNIILHEQLIASAIAGVYEKMSSHIRQITAVEEQEQARQIADNCIKMIFAANQRFYEVGLSDLPEK